MLISIEPCLFLLPLEFRSRYGGVPGRRRNLKLLQITQLEQMIRGELSLIGLRCSKFPPIAEFIKTHFIEIILDIFIIHFIQP